MRILFSLVICLLFFAKAYSQQSIFDVARYGSVEEVKQLMLINPDTINAIDVSGYPPLTLACYRSNNEVAKFLIKKVENIDGSSKYGTPLMAAVYKNNDKLVKALLENNADPNITDPNGTTPLHYAIMSRNKTIIEQLVKANANIRAKDNRGKSPIDYARMTKDIDIINLVDKK